MSAPRGPLQIGGQCCKPFDRWRWWSGSAATWLSSISNVRNPRGAASRAWILPGNGLPSAWFPPPLSSRDAVLQQRRLGAAACSIRASRTIGPATSRDARRALRLWRCHWRAVRAAPTARHHSAGGRVRPPGLDRELLWDHAWSADPHPAHNHPPRRNWLMIVAHLVWGSTMATSCGNWSSLSRRFSRVTSRQIGVPRGLPR